MKKIMRYNYLIEKKHSIDDENNNIDNDFIYLEFDADI